MTERTLLQINSVVNSGSTGRIAEEIGQTALAAGWRSVIAYGRAPHRPSASELIRIGSARDVRLHGLRARIFDDAGFGSRRATEAFIRAAEKLNPSVVHLHNLHGYYLNVDVLFRWLARSGVPVVWTLHDCWPFTGHCAYFSVSRCVRWKNGCFSCPQTRSYPASFVFDRSRKNWEQKRELFSSVKNMTLVPVSDWLAGIARGSFLGDKKIHRIYNGVDTEIFSPKADTASVRKKYGLGDRFVVLGCATSWGERKGLRHYVELAERSNDDFAVVMVGVDDRLKRELPERIVSISRTESTEDLASLYSAADVVLNLSYEETFGMTTVEGFSCGTPGIVFRATASPELITPETGFVVEQGDVDGVLAAIEAIRSRGKAAFSSACRARALACFDKRERWADYLALYESA